MPKQHPKKLQKSNMKNRARNKSKIKSEPANITTSKFYWIGLIIFTVIAILAVGIFSSIAVQKLALIMVTVLFVLAFAWQLRVKQSDLTAKTRATYIFVGAAVIGYSIWAIMVILLAATGFGIQLGNILGDQLFIAASQIIFLVVGGFIGDYLSTNSAFQGFADKIRQKVG
jgi:hypothetical protein